MSQLIPFRGLRPKNSLAAQVIAPPYDVLSVSEAKEIAAAEPRSFIRVTRSEVDLPEGVDAHGLEAYNQAKRMMSNFLSDGTLIKDDSPCFYLYSQRWLGREQHGLMALCNTEEYDKGSIKKHELTRPDKEQDRTDHIHTLGAQTGLVLLAYRNTLPSIKTVMSECIALKPAWSVTTSDDVRHTLRVISNKSLIAKIQESFANLNSLYIADGHHRSAAASRVAKLRNNKGTSGYFLAGVFPDDSLHILAYNRLVSDLNGLSKAAFVNGVKASFHMVELRSPTPKGRQHWTMYLDGLWYGLKAKSGVIPEDVVGALDVSVLQDQILNPLLGIENPRTNKRIQFVGGIRGHQFLSDAVDKGEAAVAFHLAPTGMDQLLDVADVDRLMPPKSTWFEPKLRGGVLIHQLED
jgi:uncharacterized protein (DUF1015 family)